MTAPAWTSPRGHAPALDFAALAAMVENCAFHKWLGVQLKTLDDTGCGYYPNSSFVHMDVRDPETGHVAWIDASGPGETPRYVAQWPEPAPANVDKKDTRAMIEDLLSTLEKELPAMPKDDHPAEAQSLPAAAVQERPEIERELP